MVRKTKDELKDTPLYEAGADLDKAMYAIFRAAEEADGEIPDELNDALEDAQHTFVAKVERCYHKIAEWSAQEKISDEEMKRLKTRKQSFTGRIDRLKEYVKRNIEARGITKVEGSTVTVGVQNSAPSVEILDESQIPAGHMKVTVTMPDELFSALLAAARQAGVKFGIGDIVAKREPDKASILNAWRACDGEADVPGTQVVQKTHLRFR